MKKYTYFIDGLDCEKSATANNECEAYQMVWNDLSVQMKDAVRTLDLINEEELPVIELVNAINDSVIRLKMLVDANTGHNSHLLFRVSNEIESSVAKLMSVIKK